MLEENSCRAIARPADSLHGGASSTHSTAKLTVIIPCYNERATVLEVLSRVKALHIDKSIIVIDNCSTDGTAELLRSACRSEKNVTCALAPGHAWIAGQRVLEGDGFLVILQPRNFKKGHSVKLGLALAQSEYVICQDADLEYDPSDIVRLLHYAERTGAVAVFGSRLSEAPIHWNSFQLGRIAITVLFRLLYRSSITDVATCYKLMTTTVARQLRMTTSGFDLDFEIAARLRLQGYRIVELPVSYYPRDHAHGKKIRWRDGLSASWTLLKLRLQPFGRPTRAAHSTSADCAPKYGPDGNDCTHR